MLNKQHKKLLKSRKRQLTYRKLRYLYNTGQLFRIDFKKMFKTLIRNYSFLGKRKYLVILLNSTFVFLLAYVLVFLLKEIAFSVAAKTLNINTVIMYYDVDYLIRSKDWTAEAVKVVFSTGPILTLMIAVVSGILFSLSSYETWYSRLFIMWILLHAFSQTFGEIMFGPLLNQGFGWVLDYLHYNDTTKMILVTGVFLGMLLGGFFFSRMMLLTGNIYFNYIGKINRSAFLMTQILLPFLIGTGIIVCLKQPMKNDFEVVVNGSMLLALLPALIHARGTNDLYFDEGQKKITIKWIWITVTIIILTLFRIIFGTGIRL